MQSSQIAPTVSCRLRGGPAAIASVVDDLIHAGLPGRDRLAATPETMEILALALNEILHTISEIAGEQTEADASAVELWADATLVIVCVRFRGAPLPDWLLANWDRAQEPAVLAPGIDSGWGWLLVREALDAVSHAWRGREQLLFLEKRL